MSATCFGDKTPPPPTRKAKPRKEWEAEQAPKGERIQAAERTPAQAAGLERYKQAAADVREQFRPEWSAH
jgi:hypothetical protein